MTLGANKFEVGIEYEACDRGLGTIIVISRTEKTMKVKNFFGNEFRMKIRTDDDNVEFAYDSSVGPKWREAATYKATWRCDL